MAKRKPRTFTPEFKIEAFLRHFAVKLPKQNTVGAITSAKTRYPSGSNSLFNYIISHFEFQIPEIAVSQSELSNPEKLKNEPFPNRLD